MSELYKSFMELINIKGKNAKIDFLRANYDNEPFVRTLHWLLNPFILTGISEKKIDKDIEPRIKVTNWASVMAYFKRHNTGTDRDIAVARGFISLQNEEEREFYTKLITKSLKTGVDIKTANIAYHKDFVPEFNVMLGTPIDKVDLKGNEMIFISQKLNGNRGIYLKGKLLSRSGNEYTGLDHIIYELKSLNWLETVFDGELILKNDGNKKDSENFQIGTGIINSKEADKMNIEYVIFDMISATDFKNGISAHPYSERVMQLENLDITIRKLGLKHIRVVPRFYRGVDLSQIQKWLDYAEKHDMEGVMVNLDTPYECKRTKNLIKVKAFYTCDLLCTGIERGTGKYEYTLGAVVCDYKGYKLSVGSGFTDKQRKDYYKNPDKIVGKIIEVKYKEETQNKDGGLSLQFPVFVTVRNDKKEPSYN